MHYFQQNYNITHCPEIHICICEPCFRKVSALVGQSSHKYPTTIIFTVIATQVNMCMCK